MKPSDQLKLASRSGMTISKEKLIAMLKASPRKEIPVVCDERACMALVDLASRPRAR